MTRLAQSRRARFLAPAAGILLLFLGAPCATAQGWDLFGSGDTDRETAPRTIMREDLPPSAPEMEQGRGVVREELDPVMAADGSGLPHELWTGLSAAQFAEAIAVLELPPRSPALHDLWKRLIGSDTVPVSGVDGTRFTALRVEALERTGLIDEVAAVLARDPLANSDPLLLALTARNEISLGNAERGCEIGKGLAPKQSALPSPMQADIVLINGYCAAAQGNKAAAEIQAGVMRELDLGGAGADLLAAVAGGLKAEIPQGTKLSPLDYRVAALGPPLDRPTLIAAASPALLGVLAHDPRIAPDIRLAAGEAGAALNVVSHQDLAAYYRLDGAGGDPTALDRVRLFRSAESEPKPLDKARAIRAFVEEARRAGLYWPGLMLMAEPVRTLSPSQELSWFAETAIEIDLAAGNFEGARAWARLSEQQQGPSPSAAQPHAHWMALVDIGDPAAGPQAGRNLSAIDRRFDAALLHRIATVLAALGMETPMPLWEMVSATPQPAGGHLPDTGVLSQLADASQKKQFGRTVLLVMRALGPDGASGAHMIALGDALRALNRAGLKAEAHRLALEALLASWPRSVSQ